jgi:hypothetical protein
MAAWHLAARRGRRKPRLSDVLEQHADRLERLVSMLECQQAVNLEVFGRLEGLDLAGGRHLERLEALERNLGAVDEALEEERRLREAEDGRVWRVLHSRTDHLA